MATICFSGKKPLPELLRPDLTLRLLCLMSIKPVVLLKLAFTVKLSRPLVLMVLFPFLKSPETNSSSNIHSVLLHPSHPPTLSLSFCLSPLHPLISSPSPFPLLFLPFPLPSSSLSHSSHCPLFSQVLST